MPAARALAVTGLVALAVVLQVGLFAHLSYDGVVPDLVLLLVVAAALVRGPEFAAVLGFLSGLAIDVAPPADHITGRWALTLLLVGYLAGRVRHDAAGSALSALGTVAASSFVGTSIFALSGMLLHDPDLAVADALRVIPVSVVYDVLLAPFVLPLAMRVFRRLEPHQVAYR